MTALQVIESRHSDSVDFSILELLQADASHGHLIMEVGNFPRVDLLPLTSCESPQELGCIKKLFELGQVAQLAHDRRNRDQLTRARARQVKHKLNYCRLAKSLKAHAGQIKGPRRIVEVWGLHLKREDGHVRAMLSVIFAGSKRGEYYGYYFHLKSALFLCGLSF